ncbi:MAG: FAD binding domain-containing protein, partial [Chloroflexi bacterium]|nr:FAD binding domain-containing protein [Chloroflexota bacterium]
MALWQHYHRPATVEEALSLLAGYEGQARVVAGGTDLLLEMQQGHKPPVEALVDVTAIAELNGIGLVEGRVEVGAAVPHSEIVRSPVILQQATCLVESCGVIGGPQVRNVATLGGNVAHALPAADGTTALVALEAEAEVASPAGRSWWPVLSLFQGVGRSAVDQSRELITRFRFAPAYPGTATAFKRIMRPQGVALPILACAVWLAVEAAGPDSNPRQVKIVEARICLGPVRPAPCRAGQAEAALRGRPLAEALDDCVGAAQAEFSPRTSKHRATAGYRREMIAVLLRRALPL